MKFRKKPVVIEAIQFDGVKYLEACRFAPGTVLDLQDGRAVLKIQTLEGEMTALAGDWIIRGIRGEFYPCKPDIFAATYEPVEEQG